MERAVSILGFAGYSGSGKTTLIERLIPLLEQEGIRTAVIKHDAHGLRFDTDGKDSQRFSAAGTACSLVNGPSESAIFLGKPLTLEESVRAAALLSDAQLILIEGYKHNSYARIGIMRRETGKGFPDAAERFAALVTDDETVKAAIPVFHPDDVKGIAAFILENLKMFEVPVLDRTGQIGC